MDASPPTAPTRRRTHEQDGASPTASRTPMGRETPAAVTATAEAVAAAAGIVSMATTPSRKTPAADTKVTPRRSSTKRTPKSSSRRRSRSMSETPGSQNYVRRQHRLVKSQIWGLFVTEKKAPRMKMKVFYEYMHKHPMIEVVGAPDKVLADDLARKRDRVYVTRKSLFAAFQALMVQGYGDQLQDDSGSTRVFRDNLKEIVEWVIKKRERSKDEAAVKWAEEVIDLRAFCNGLIDEIRRNISVDIRNKCIQLITRLINRNWHLRFAALALQHKVVSTAKFIKMCEREGLFVAESFDPRDASMDYSEKIIRLSFAIRANHALPSVIQVAEFVEALTACYNKFTRPRGGKPVGDGFSDEFCSPRTIKSTFRVSPSTKAKKSLNMGKGVSRKSRQGGTQSSGGEESCSGELVTSQSAAIQAALAQALSLGVTPEELAAAAAAAAARGKGTTNDTTRKRKAAAAAARKRKAATTAATTAAAKRKAAASKKKKKKKAATPRRKPAAKGRKGGRKKTKASGGKRRRAKAAPDDSNDDQSDDDLSSSSDRYRISDDASSPHTPRRGTSAGASSLLNTLAAAAASQEEMLALSPSVAPGGQLVSEPADARPEKDLLIASALVGMHAESPSQERRAENRKRTAADDGQPPAKRAKAELVATPSSGIEAATPPGRSQAADSYSQVSVSALGEAAHASAVMSSHVAATAAAAAAAMI